MTSRPSAYSEQRELERRLEVLRLPVTPLTPVGWLHGPPGTVWEREPECLGVGPDGLAYVVRRARQQARRRLVTVHDGGRWPVATIELHDHDVPFRASFVQPLPGGRILLVAARNQQGPNAEIWSADGEREHRGDLGDAIEHVLTTPEGAIWVGYFDEALGSRGPGAHGLVRFDDTLATTWLYPFDAGLPTILDCYALTVTGETVWHCAYSGFHIGSVRGGHAADHGEAPRHSATALLIEGRHGALAGGHGAEYDLVTPFRLDPDGIVPHGPARRLVLPDGMELHGVRTVTRGATLHVFRHTGWWRIALGELTDDSTSPRR
ncbi:hypothetical protein ACIA8K_07255 [Catenuloplanes sp. NPDC051500]|uniref:hypothetical protein n=1 Tax=Catenuloplanes sp. NPDC051500 TaxID=3363959 RepID=UPI0037A5EFFF